MTPPQARDRWGCNSEGQRALDYKRDLVPGLWARRDGKVTGALSPDTGLMVRGSQVPLARDRMGDIDISLPAL